MKVTIEVTAEDIANGRQRSPGNCPVALAGKRVLPDGSYFAVCPEYVHYVSPEDRVEFVNVCRVEFPSWVGQTIKGYDDTGKMEPFSFDLDIPD